MGAIKQDGYITIGRTKRVFLLTKQWLKVADIRISLIYRKHINNKHKNDLDGFTDIVDYLTFVLKHHTEIRKGSENSILLVVKRPHKSKIMAIVLEIDKRKSFWNVKTAFVMKACGIERKELLWKKK